MVRHRAPPPRSWNAEHASRLTMNGSGPAILPDVERSPPRRRSIGGTRLEQWPPACRARARSSRLLTEVLMHLAEFADGSRRTTQSVAVACKATLHRSLPPSLEPL